MLFTNVHVFLIKQIFYGSVIFRYFPVTPTRPLTLINSAHINDGHWHSLSLSLTHSYTLLSIDEGRSVAMGNGNITVTTNTVSFGGSTNNNLNNNNKFNGCLKLFFLTADSNLTNSFNLTSINVATGCHDNDPCANNVTSCPVNSECRAGWRSFSCDCSHRYFPDRYTCIDPCPPTACGGEGRGRCSFDIGERDGKRECALLYEYTGICKYAC